MASFEPSQCNYLIIWEFRVRAGKESEFERAYGPDGVWAQFFAREEGYAGTELNRDLRDLRRYLTLDFWSSREAYTTFREQHRIEYESIDRECEELTESEVEIGSFERVIRRVT